MKKTVINLNGNSAESLIGELHDVLDAFDELQAALNKVTLHSRNYCPQGSNEAMDAFQEDVSDMRSLDKQLADAKAYIEECEEIIDKQT